LIFVPVSDHLSLEKEKARYDMHQNKLDNEGYRKFLSRILPPLLPRINNSDKGLDYGSGPVPVLSQILTGIGYDTAHYDPFYRPDPSLLERQYDFVTCTEVVEHFRDPKAEWQSLIKLVKKEGWLAVMTQLTDEEMNFGTWHYKDDATHICFYADRTFNWIPRANPRPAEIHGNSIVLLQC